VTAPPKTSTGPLRVLIVEDDASNREVVRMVLEMSGHRVFSAGSGGEALERAAEGPFDVVLLDLKLPDQSGGEISAALRARLSPAPRIIITSGTSIDAAEATTLGAEAVLEKPFTPDRLLAVLDGDRNFT